MNIFNPYRFLSNSFPPDYNNGTMSFGFSLRQLTNNAVNCIRVERTSDNATQDIGFVNGELDTVSLLSFVGSSDGIVRILYNQGYATIGNASATAGNTIVQSGVLNTLNGKPCIIFIGGNVSSNYLTTGSTGICSSNDARKNSGYGDNYSEVFVGSTTNGDRVVRSPISGGRTHFLDSRRFRHNSTTITHVAPELHNVGSIRGSCWDSVSENVRMDQQGVDYGIVGGLNGLWACSGISYGYDPMTLQEHIIWDYNADTVQSTELGRLCDLSNDYWLKY